MRRVYELQPRTMSDSKNATRLAAGDLAARWSSSATPDGRGGCFIPDVQIISLNEANDSLETCASVIARLAKRIDARETTTQVVPGVLGLDVCGEPGPYVAGWGRSR